MKLNYKIDKIKQLITLELKEDAEQREVMRYMAAELSSQHQLCAMNERPIFLHSCEECFEKEKSTLNIKYLNDDEGLQDILDIFSGHFGINIADLPSTPTVEGTVDFSIPDKKRFDAIIAAITPNGCGVAAVSAKCAPTPISPSSDVLSKNVSEPLSDAVKIISSPSRTKAPSTLGMEKLEGLLTYSFDQQKKEKTVATSHKKRRGQILPKVGQEKRRPSHKKAKV